MNKVKTYWSKYFSIYLSFAVVGYLIGCRGKEIKMIENRDVEIFTSGIIIPYFEDSLVASSRTTPFLSHIAQLMKLPDIAKEPRRLEIRVWIWDSPTKPKYYINMMDHKGQLDCTVGEFHAERVNGKDYIIITRYWKNLHPKSGWQAFTNKIASDSILRLPSGKPYELQEQCLTGMGYIQFEIVTDGKYRFFEYLAPSFYRTVDHHSKVVFDFLEYFDSEMNLSIYAPDKKIVADPRF